MKDNDSCWLCILFLIVVLFVFAAFQAGQCLDRYYIRQKILSQHTGTQIVRVPELKITLIPLDKGFISDWDAKK
jgi:hypothetical protein